MNIFYKDYELASFELHESGYLMPEMDTNKKEYTSYSNEISDFIIKPENNISYFSEANILTKININEDNYFDFNKAIIDIGCHLGCYSFRSKFNKGYAFEPNKFICAFTQMNLIMHDRFNTFELHNVLLSDNTNPIKFDGFSNEYTFEEDLTEVSKKLMEVNIKPRDIQLVTPHILDEYNCKDVGLIKIDVEGMEEKVLKGGLGTIVRNNYPPILFELWNLNSHLFNTSNGHHIVNFNINKEKYNSLKTFLEDLGYEILWHWGDSETHLAINKKFYK